MPHLYETADRSIRAFVIPSEGEAPPTLGGLFLYALDGRSMFVGAFPGLYPGHYRLREERTNGGPEWPQGGVTTNEIGEAKLEPREHGLGLRVELLASRMHQPRVDFSPEPTYPETLIADVALSRVA
jgi:hypothetical protein